MAPNVSTKRSISILYSLSGAALVMIVIAYVLGVANFSLKGFLPGIFKLLPIILTSGFLIGIVAAWLNTRGCFTMIVAGVAALVATGVTAVASSNAPLGIIPIQAYGIGIFIGILLGWMILAMHNIVRAILQGVHT